MIHQNQFCSRVLNHTPTGLQDWLLGIPTQKTLAVSTIFRGTAIQNFAQLQNFPAMAFPACFG